MPASFAPSKPQLILGLCVPLAVLVGFFLAEPLKPGSMAVLILVLAVLTFPLVLKWHHPLLVLSWNAAITPQFFPGKPHLWMLMAGISLFMAVLSRSVSYRHRIFHVPAITRPLLALVLVVLITASATGGFGVRVLGSASYGGRGYFYILAAAVGYFALGSKRINPSQQRLYIGLFFLSGITGLLPNLVYSGGASFWWLLRFLPTTFITEQIQADYTLSTSIWRIAGLVVAAPALFYWVLASYGIRGLFVWRQPWRMLLFILAWAACLASGFRSVLVLFGFVFLIQFFLEGLHRTRLLPVLVGAFTLIAALTLANIKSMPLVVQRSVSFLPIEVDPVARASAKQSTEWRIEMWLSVLPEVPRHLLLGKGYSINPNDLQMSMESYSRGLGASYQTAVTAGDYHNGPLSILIPFGLWGVFAFVWFLGASIHYLYGNYRRGLPELRVVNTFLLSLFLARTVFFLLVFGVFYRDLWIFVGLVGMGVMLNGKTQVVATGEVSEGSQVRHSGGSTQLPPDPQNPATRHLN